MDIEIGPPWLLAFETGAWAGRVGKVEGPIAVAGRD